MTDLNIYSKEQTDNLLSAKADTSALAGKQDILIAGTGITITGNTISATGGSAASSIKIKPIIIPWMERNTLHSTSYSQTKYNITRDNAGYITGATISKDSAKSLYFLNGLVSSYKSIVLQALEIKGTPSGTYIFGMCAEVSGYANNAEIYENCYPCKDDGKLITVTVVDGEITDITTNNSGDYGHYLSCTFDPMDKLIMMKVNLIPMEGFN